jgi:hypothetical protein
MQEKQLGSKRDWPPSEGVMGISDNLPVEEGYLDISVDEMWVC